MLIVGDLIPVSSPIENNIMKTEVPESAGVEYELPEYPIQMTEERQKQERRVSVYVNVFSARQHILSPSVCLSVRHTGGSVKNG